MDKGKHTKITQRQMIRIGRTAIKYPLPTSKQIYLQGLEQQVFQRQVDVGN